jgi:hypothetical protein
VVIKATGVFGISLHELHARMTSDMVEASCLWVIFTFILETTEIVPQVIKGFATYGRVTSNPRGHFLDGFIPGPDEREVNINVSHT